MQQIAFYISGHGYGHATRSIEIIRHLQHLDGDIHVHIKTYAPDWLFRLDLDGRYTYHFLEHDIGAVQADSFSVDKHETLRRYDALIQKKQQMIDHEMMFVKRNDIGLIVSDISPLAFEVAEKADLPSIAIGNFSWDWIYADWLNEYPQYRHVVDDILQAYAKADLLLRLPFYGDMSAFSPIKDVPVVGRKAANSKEDTLRRIGLLHERRKIVLLALRRQDLAGIEWKTVESIPNTMFISFSGEYPVGNFVRLPPECVPFQDLVNAVDGVLSKPGYGIVAECYLNQTPIVYVPRADFAEDRILRDCLEKCTVAQMLPLVEFRRGNWGQYLSLLFQKRPHWASFEIDGGDVVAKNILERLS